MRANRFWLIVLAIGLLATPALAQNPTGTVSGQITDAEGGALPGVLVTASSPNLQGERTTYSTANGDYLLRFLPPGDYVITYELQGFSTVRREVKVSAAQALELSTEMALEEISEEIVVTGAFETVSTSTQSSTTYEQVFIEELPVDRDIESAVVLTPGVSQTGPGDNIVISGAQSYENLFLVNGVVVNENLRGQPFDLFIEDAIQETTTSTSGISAEYGRFAGGVVNVITKSGGNDFTGSLRVNLDNEDWAADRPDQTNKADDINQTYEATVGGYLWRDRLWFFLAGRDVEDVGTAQTTATALSFDESRFETRYEAKLTAALADGHRLVGSYLEIDEEETGVRFGSVLDLESIYDRELPQELKALNYTGVLTSNFFIEAQYSEREFTFVDSGAPTTDLIDGTLFVDRPTGQRWHSPTFCGVCEPDEQRNNENYLLKGSLFLSNETLGSHDLVAGYDHFTDIRIADNHQSGSDFRIILDRTLIDPDGTTLYPVFSNNAYIQWNPILQGSKGTDFVTESYFLNDTWRLNNRWSFNLGLRYDVNDGVDSEGKKVVDDSKLSPRLGATYDVLGDGEWIVNASYAEYVAAIANSQANATSPGGSPATFQWFYRGPDINAGIPFDSSTRVVTDTTGIVDADTALQMLFDWFDSIGGTNSSPTRALFIPGGTSVINETLASPSTIEYTLGLTKRFGSDVLVRVDYVRREGEDFYVDRRDLSTGSVVTPNGALADLSVIENNDSLLERTYDGVHTNFRWRVGERLDVGGNYTWSHLRGNVDGETRNSGPVRSGILNYPEYRDPAWNAPKGDLGADQRHRARLWGTYRLLRNDRNDLSLGVLQTYLSGRAYEAVGEVDTRPYVSNPGYVLPPATVNYFFSGRGAFRTDDVFSTDISLNYAFNLPLFGRDVKIFVQPEVQNIFNQQEIITTDDRYFDVTVIDAENNSSSACGGGGCQEFNPFTTTPVEGVHWEKGPNFGEATNPLAYQRPRTFRVSVGFRF